MLCDPCGGRDPWIENHRSRGSQLPPCRAASQHLVTLGPLEPQKSLQLVELCHESHLEVTSLSSAISCCVTPGSVFTSLFPGLSPRTWYRSEFCQHKVHATLPAILALAWTPLPWVLCSGSCKLARQESRTLPLAVTLTSVPPSSPFLTVASPFCPRPGPGPLLAV